MPESPSRVAVITDSTAYLPPELARRQGIRIVPLHVRLGERVGRDTCDIGPAELAEALGRRDAAVTTSRPTPAEFGTAFREALADADAVVSVHLSRELSGTWDAARLAGDEINVGAGATLVRIVDSRSTGMGLGFAALAAADAARDGADPADVEAAAAAVAGRSRVFFCVDSLEQLRRGGRIGAAAAVVGTALAVKPVLHVVDGRIAPLEKVRTSARAATRLVELAVAAAGAGRPRLAVHHLRAAERAEALAGRLRERIPAAADCVVTEVGAAIGAHAGTGLLGVVVVPAEGASASGGA